jgi:hypothetical protein
MHETQQHVNGTRVSMAPFLKWRRLCVPFTKEPILSAQKLSNVHRADALYRQCFAVAVLQQVTCPSGIPPPDPR